MAELFSGKTRWNNSAAKSSGQSFSATFGEFRRKSLAAERRQRRRISPNSFLFVFATPNHRQNFALLFQREFLNCSAQQKTSAAPIQKQATMFPGKHVALGVRTGACEIHV